MAKFPNTAFDYFLRLAGLIALLGGLVYGGLYLYQNSLDFRLILAYFLMSIGAIALIGGFLFAIFQNTKARKWIWDNTKTTIVGAGLIQAIDQVVQELQERRLQRKSVSTLGAHIIWRLTRLGMVGLIIAVIPIWILLNQNTILNRQNEKIDLQNNLLEADRRSALIVMMSNIMDKVDQEVKAVGNNKDTLSDVLIGRIAALSQSFKPYRALEEDTLAAKALSPERGQLLTALVKSQLDSTTYRKIYTQVKFTFADLRGADLRGADLSGADLRGADLRDADLLLADLHFADLRGADLRGADLSGANLRDADLRGADLRDADLLDAYLNGADLSGADLSGADLSGADLSAADLSAADLRGADLILADLSDANLRAADLRDANLRAADLRDADLENVKNLTYDQLLSTGSLYEAKGIQPEWLKKFGEEKDCLCTETECPADLRGAYLSGAYLIGADLSGADLRGADLFAAYLSYADLRDADLRGAYLSYADLRGANLRGADLRGANLEGFQNLTFKQLKSTRSLFQIKNLDPKLKAELKAEKECLFREKGCPEK